MVTGGSWGKFLAIYLANKAILVIIADVYTDMFTFLQVTSGTRSFILISGIDIFTCDYPASACIKFISLSLIYRKSLISNKYEIAPTKPILGGSRHLLYCQLKSFWKSKVHKHFWYFHKTNTTVFTIFSTIKRVKANLSSSIIDRISLFHCVIHSASSVYRLKNK